MPKVSIIVPVYNTAKYLRRCADALVNQTLSDIEIIFINDGSTDDSPNILREYQQNYPDKVRIIDKENEGQSVARNLGMVESTGDYIGFADSDDFVELTLFEKLYNMAIENDADMVECHFHYMEETSDGFKELRARGIVRQYESKEEMFIDPQVSPWNKLYKRSLLIDNNIFFPEGLIYEDTSFYVKTIPYINKYSYLDEKLVYYIYRGDSTMNANKSRKVGDFFSVLDDILKFYDRKIIRNQYHEELEYFCTKLLLCSSLSRIGRVKDKRLQGELLDRTFSFIRTNFPDYMKNKYYSGKLRVYIGAVKRWNSRIISKVLEKILKG